jgi:CheY-like chemotaxis protein
VEDRILLLLSHTCHCILYIVFHHSVYSAGEGHGCTFTVKIPLMDTPALTRDVSVTDEDLRQSLSRRSSYVHGCLDFAKMHAHNVSFASLVSLSGEINSMVESNQLSQGRGGNGVVDSDGQSEYCVDGSMRSGTLTAPQSPLRNPTALAFSDQNPLCIHVSVPLPLPSPFFFAKDHTRNDSTHFDILIVDDSKLNRKMLAKSLKASCHRCEEAEDGAQAVEMVKLKWSNEDGMYDVILMDFMMPRMDGPTATEILRDMGYRGIIIGVTGNALPSDIKHFTVKGANRVFLKPVDVDALQSALLSLLNPC